MPTAITRDELRAAIDEGSITVVDALPPAPYGERHLPGALNLVAGDADERVDQVLSDKAAAIVTYSTDAGCTRGPALAERLQALGYSDVRAYREGIEDWVAAGLPVEHQRAVTLDLDELAVSPTAALFEGHSRAGVDISIDHNILWFEEESSTTGGRLDMCVVRSARSIPPASSTRV